jgi:hypothetical protein
MSAWRNGPAPPVFFGAMVDHPDGGVILVGGKEPYPKDNAVDTLYRLAHAGPSATWELLPVKLETPRWGHLALVLPDYYVNCTLIS